MGVTHHSTLYTLPARRADRIAQLLAAPDDAVRATEAVGDEGDAEAQVRIAPANRGIGGTGWPDPGAIGLINEQATV
jgi:hypothetical protein